MATLPITPVTSEIHYTVTSFHLFKSRISNRSDPLYIMCLCIERNGSEAVDLGTCITLYFNEYWIIFRWNSSNLRHTFLEGWGHQQNNWPTENFCIVAPIHRRKDIMQIHFLLHFLFDAVDGEKYIPKSEITAMHYCLLLVNENVQKITTDVYMYGVPIIHPSYSGDLYV